MIAYVIAVWLRCDCYVILVYDCYVVAVQFLQETFHIFWERDQLIAGVKAAAASRGVTLSVYAQRRIRLPGRAIKVSGGTSKNRDAAQTRGSDVQGRTCKGTDVQSVTL